MIQNWTDEHTRIPKAIVKDWKIKQYDWLQSSVKTWAKNILEYSPITWPNPNITIIENEQDFYQNIISKKNELWAKSFSFPIYILWVDKTVEYKRSRKKLCTNFMWELDESEEYVKWFWLRINRILTILWEIIQNSLDHTNWRVYFWIQISINSSRDLLNLSFIVADEWQWIYEWIKKFIWDQELSFEDAYAIAKTPKWSSIGWKSNKWAWLDQIESRTTGVNLIQWVKVSLSRYDNWRTEVIHKSNISIQNTFDVIPEIKFYYIWEIEIDLSAKVHWENQQTTS